MAKNVVLTMLFPYYTDDLTVFGISLDLLGVLRICVEEKLDVLNC